jgi:hypothetical protein
VLRELVVLAHCPIGSCGREGNDLERRRFPVLKTIGEDPERQSLRLCLRLLRRVAVHKHAGQLDNFSNPPAIVFPIHFDFEVHVRIIPQSAVEAERLAPELAAQTRSRRPLTFKPIRSSDLFGMLSQ